MVSAALLFDRRLAQRQLFDFDLMVARSLELLRQHEKAARLIAARYPWLLVDEYQDLGPVLHALVNHLHDAAHVNIAAFGDPDQTIMDFAGADPTYLLELGSRRDFETFPLEINYRCGKAIITASHATVNGSRSHQPDPVRSDPGLIEPIGSIGGLDGHAAIVISKIDELEAMDVPLHHVAILYPRRGPLLDELIRALDSSIYEYVHEGDARLPHGDLADFVRDCAARAIAGPQPVGYVEVGPSFAVPTIHDLADDYYKLLDTGGIPRPERRSLLRRLSRSLKTVEPEQDLKDWLDELVRSLGLETIAKASPQLRDHDAIDGFIKAANRHKLAVGEIAGALRTGKVTLTTYHAAKGREWDFVILPGLIDGIMPRRIWSKRDRRYLPAPPDQFHQDRRAFYVGMTRAKRAVILIYGDYWKTDWGKNCYGVSPFVKAVFDQMDRA
jgi:DNA helicase-2/ATP-dependent DNA helicase PcrA